ncbi:universal stress protein [Methylibium sp.]|uniref:universal stress protein n=1 Tax=Methylibium sp. TaxID=2067992 RepID=UPI00286C5F69|nr:universal stress protein [Methylibium sp.]
MKMLVAIDGSQFTQRMLDFVVKHPEMIGSAPDITLVTAVPAIPAHAARFLDRALLKSYYDEEAEAVLAPARTAFAQAGIDVKSLPLKGHPATVISAHASSGKYDLVLMGSHGNSLLGNVVLGSVVTGVLAHCKTPVLIVR